MTIYSTVLFIHVVSAIGLFITLAAEGAIVFRIRSAQTVEEARFPTRVPAQDEECEWLSEGQGVVEGVRGLPRDRRCQR